MDLLKHIKTPITAIVVIATLMISSVATLNLQQASAFGFVERQKITEFVILTEQFENNIINLITDTEGSGEPPLGKFLKSTGQFKRDIVNSVLAGHDIPGDPTIPNLVEKYGFSVVVDPEDPIISPVILNYQNRVLVLFGVGP